MFNAGAAAAALKLDTSGFTQGMLQATSIAEVFPQTVTAFLANPLLGLVDVAGKAVGAIGAVASAWVDAIGSFAAKADDVGDMAASLGVSPEFLSGWGAAMADAGGSVEGFGDQLGILNQRAAEAAAGNKEAVASFARVGVSAEFLAENLGNTEAIARAVTDGIADLGTVAEQTAAANDTFGRSAKGIVGAFAQGSAGLDKYAETVRRLGGTVTTEDARMANSATKLFGYVNAAIDGIARAAARPVLRFLEKHFGDAEAGIVKTAEWLQEAIEPMVEKIMELAEAAAEWWEENGADIEQVFGALEVAAEMVGIAMDAAFKVGYAAVKPLIVGVKELNRALEETAGISGGIGEVWDTLTLGPMRAVGLVPPEVKAPTYYPPLPNPYNSGAGGAVPGGGTIHIDKVEVRADGTESQRQMGEKVLSAVHEAKRQASLASETAKGQRVLSGL